MRVFRRAEAGPRTTRPLASGGRYLYSSGSVDDTLTLNFAGSRIDVIFVQHPALGSFAVVIDGNPVQTVNSTATDATFGARISLSLSAGSHTLRIVPVSGVIAIDAFAVEAVAEPIVPPTEEPVVTEPLAETPIPPDVPLLTPEPPGGPTPESPESFGRG